MQDLADLGLMLSRLALMVQATVLDGQFLYLSPPFDDGRVPAEVGVGILGLHGNAELPGDDVSGIVVQDGRQIEPAPADHFEIGDVGLPQLIYGRCLFPERIIDLDGGKGYHQRIHGANLGPGTQKSPQDCLGAW